MSVEKMVSPNCYRTLLTSLQFSFQNLEALKSMRLSLNTKSETAFKILNNPSKTPGCDKHPHESQTLPTANHHAKNSEHAIDG